MDKQSIPETARIAIQYEHEADIVETLEWLETQNISADIASPTTLIVRRNDFAYLDKAVLQKHARYKLFPVKRTSKFSIGDGRIDKKALIAERDDLRSELKYIKIKKKE